MRGLTRGTLLFVLALMVLAALPSARAQQPGPDWDPRLDELGVTYQPAPDCADGCWRLVSARLLNEEESAGLHHIFAKLLDADGEQLADRPWTVAWYDGRDTLLSKPAPDWGDAPLWSCYFPDQGEHGPYIAFAGTDEARSDVVAGMGLPYCLHMSFQLVWRWVPAGIDPPAPPTATPAASATPTPTATPTPCTVCTDRLWLPLVGGGVPAP